MISVETHYSHVLLQQSGAACLPTCTDSRVENSTRAFFLLAYYVLTLGLSSDLPLICDHKHESADNYNNSCNEDEHYIEVKQVLGVVSVML